MHEKSTQLSFWQEEHASQPLTASATEEVVVEMPMQQLFEDNGTCTIAAPPPGKQRRAAKLPKPQMSLF